MAGGHCCYDHREGPTIMCPWCLIVECPSESPHSDRPESLVDWKGEIGMTTSEVGVEDTSVMVGEVDGGQIGLGERSCL